MDTQIKSARDRAAERPVRKWGRVRQEWGDLTAK